MISFEVHAFHFKQVVRNLGIESACVHVQSTSPVCPSTEKLLQSCQTTLEHSETNASRTRPAPAATVAP